MKKIEISLEYGCFPVWIYDDAGSLIDTTLPPEASGDSELSDSFNDIQARFEATFLNDSKEFTDKGFASKEEERSFYKDLDVAVEKLSNHCSGFYEIVKLY